MAVNHRARMVVGGKYYIIQHDPGPSSFFITTGTGGTGLNISCALVGIAAKGRGVGGRCVGWEVDGVVLVMACGGGGGRVER